MVRVGGVSKRFGDSLAVDNLSFEIGEGEIVGLLGPNGAGKTTTMRIMTGYLAPDTGGVTIEGIDVLNQPQKAQAIIGYMPENNPLYREKLVSEMLDYSAGLRQLPLNEKKSGIDFAVTATNIAEVFYKPIGQLSKGYKQRVGMAVALLHRPRVLILDEPTEGLDPNQRGEVRTLIKKLAREQTIVISTHVLAEADAVCSRLIIINRGKLVADGTVGKLIRGAGMGKWLEVDIEGGGVEAEFKKRKWQIETVRHGEKRVVLRIASPGREALQPEISKMAMANKWVIWKLAEQSQRLEELFQNLTK